jgi:SAM-dependent methyltransferase
VANEGEVRRWNAPVWATAWPKRERLTEAVSSFLLEVVRAQPGTRVCDIGCGGGTLTISLARAVDPGGVAVGLDLSAPLLDLARRRAGGVANAEFVQMDVQTATFDGPPFDVAVSQFGVMFFDEPLAAFGSIRKLLVPGGRLVFACWQGVEQNPWHVGTALRPLVPPPPLPPPGKSPVGPFVFGDDEYVREILEGAGFASVRSTAHEISVRGPADAVVDRSLLGFMGVDPERMDEAEAVMDRHLARFDVGGAGDEAYEFPLAFRIFDAIA